jgi:hypothetical protein
MSKSSFKDVPRPRGWMQDYTQKKKKKKKAQHASIL